MNVKRCRDRECISLNNTYCMAATQGHIEASDPNKVYFGYACQIRWLLACPKELILSDEDQKTLDEKKARYDTGVFVLKDVVVVYDQ